MVVIIGAFGSFIMIYMLWQLCQRYIISQLLFDLLLLSFLPYYLCWSHLGSHQRTSAWTIIGLVADLFKQLLADSSPSNVVHSFLFFGFEILPTTTCLQLTLLGVKWECASKSPTSKKALCSAILISIPFPLNEFLLGN